jgi:hypothetical protein
MTDRIRIAGAVVVVAVLSLAALAIQAQRDDEQARVMRLSPGKPLLFDFSGSPHGGVLAGSFNNFALRLQLSEPTRKLVVRTGEPGDVIATYDYAACSKGQERLIERTVANLPRGDAMFVDYIDIEMLPSLQKDLRWTGGVCYGFRTGGKWQWQLVSTPLEHDAAANRVRARLWIKQPSVDALKLVFDESVPNLFVRTVTVTTQPPEAVR